MNLWLIWQQPNVILEVLFWGLCLRLSPSLPVCFTFYISPAPYILLFSFFAKIVFRDASPLALTVWGPCRPELFSLHPSLGSGFKARVSACRGFSGEAVGSFLWHCAVCGMTSLGFRAVAMQ